MQRHELSLVPFQNRMDLSCFDVPEPCCVVHRASCNEISMWIKRNSYNLALMPCIGTKELRSLGTPELGSLIKGPSNNFIPEGHIKCQAVHSILMSIKRMHEIARFSIPDLAGSVVAACDELVAVLIEGAVGQWQHVSL